MRKVCCVTGNRPQKFPWKYGEGEKYENYLAEMRKEVESLIQNGYRDFISGGALGVDQDFADIVLRYKDTYPDITLEIAVPYRAQSSQWSEAEKRHYDVILMCADTVTVLMENYAQFCMQKRNEYMVQKSDLVLAFWNGDKSGGTYYTISFARKKGKPLKIRPL